MQFLKELFGKGHLLESSLLKIFNESNLSNEDLVIICKEIINLNPPKIISQDFFLNNLNKILININNEPIKNFLISFEKKEDVCVNENSNQPINKNGVEILEEYNIKPRKILVEDFVKSFRDRYLTLKNYYQDKNLENLCSIGKLSTQQRNFSIIGLVYDKRLTKNKNLLIELEDLTGKIIVLVRQDKSELFEKANDLVLDEVVAIKGVGSREIIFANEIITLDVNKEIKKSPEEIYVAFTADLHIGSKKFFSENFNNFISWLNGEVGSNQQQEISKKIKYLFIVGDVVDGVGVYPRQEPELLIKDIKEQYHLLYTLLQKIRRDITIILCPGGKHDAVCQVEPQPKLTKEVAPELYQLENLILVNNPCLLRIAHLPNFAGFDILIYHGDSYDYYMDRVDSLRFNNAKLKPDMISHFLLKKRHLAPTHTSTTYYPCEKDLLLIRKVPDILVSGHIHKSAVSRYNGILTIACSCWQSKTSYQEKFGHEPDPCKVPLLNLKTGKTSVIDFS